MSTGRFLPTRQRRGFRTMSEKKNLPIGTLVKLVAIDISAELALDKALDITAGASIWASAINGMIAKQRPMGGNIMVSMILEW